jgi:hypothetical protein
MLSPAVIADVTIKLVRNLQRSGAVGALESDKTYVVHDSLFLLKSITSIYKRALNFVARPENGFAFS